MRFLLILEVIEVNKLDEMPKEGQFIAVWYASDCIWSDSLFIEDGVLHIYNSYNDELQVIPKSQLSFYKEAGAEFYQ